MKQSVASFLSNMLAVILGIVITFTVQGMIDRANDRREVRKALELVRSELVSNREDVTAVNEFFELERESARFLKDNAALLPVLDRQDSLTVETVNYHQSIIHADVYVAFLHDALELLKMSSLFPKIGDNSLSMKIIRAYDCCEAMADNIKRYVNARGAQSDENLPGWILSHDMAPYTDPSDIDAAITAINKFLRKE